MSIYGGLRSPRQLIIDTRSKWIDYRRALINGRYWYVDVWRTLVFEATNTGAFDACTETCMFQIQTRQQLHIQTNPLCDKFGKHTPRQSRANAPGDLERIISARQCLRINTEHHTNDIKGVINDPLADQFYSNSCIVYRLWLWNVIYSIRRRHYTVGVYVCVWI